MNNLSNRLRAGLHARAIAQAHVSRAAGCIASGDHTGRTPGRAVP